MLTPYNQTNNNLIAVRSEAEARSYPIAPGNSITFKDETAPFVYTKTMGMSALEQPRFDKYRLVKEEAQEEKKEIEMPSFVTHDELAALAEELREEIESMKKKPTTKKKEVAENDAE
jgi:hypothetical protein